MSLVTIVALVPLDFEPGQSVLPAMRSAVERLGRETELLVRGEGRRVVASGRVPGLADAALRGLREARGEFVVLVDLGRPYVPEDLAPVLEPLLRNEADLCVGCPGEARLSAKLFAPVARTVDPWSGIVAVRRSTFESQDRALRPVGERFALELVQRIEGRRRDVPLPDREGDAPQGWHLDDVRHLKRLADDRLGTLSRLLQFCVVGASGMVVDLTTYAVLQWELKATSLGEKRLPILGSPMDLALAGVLSVGLALLWNFSLNRRLTFNDAKRTSVVRQFVTYVLSNALGILLSLTLRLALPRWFGYFDRHKLAAAVVGIVASTGVSFTMARWLVFPHQKPKGEADPSANVDEASQSSSEPSTATAG